MNDAVVHNPTPTPSPLQAPLEESRQVADTADADDQDTPIADSDQVGSVDDAAAPDREAVKDARRVLRLVQSHLTQARLRLGVHHETLGLVEVLHHPHYPLPELNYVTPRKSTAWVSIKEVEQGLEALDKYNRPRRVEYIEGLFLPVFAKSLHALGLQMEREVPVLVYVPPAEQTQPCLPTMPDGTSIHVVNTHESSALWWYVWRNAYYEVVTHPIEPVFIGQSLMQIALGQHLDLVMNRYGFPIGAARVTLDPQEHTAHLAALTLMREARTTDMVRVLQRYAIAAALQRGSALVFTSGETEPDRQISRENGFVDYGKVICYAEIEKLSAENRLEMDSLNSKDSRLNDSNFLAQPILILR